MSASDPGPSGDRPWWASEHAHQDAGHERDDGSSERVPPHEHRADADAAVCQVCPICALLRVVDEVRPEVLDHLTEAGRHLTLAAKAFLDAQAEAYERQGRGREGGGLERIDLDDE